MINQSVFLVRWRIEGASENLTNSIEIEYLYRSLALVAMYGYARSFLVLFWIPHRSKTVKYSSRFSFAYNSLIFDVHLPLFLDADRGSRFTCPRRLLHGPRSSFNHSSSISHSISNISIYLLRETEFFLSNDG